MLSGIDVFSIPYKWVSTYISDQIPALPCPGWSPDALCSRYKVRPDDHVEAGRWLAKEPLIDPWMADPAVPVKIEAVPGHSGVWSADRQSLWRPGEADFPDFPCRWASGRGASAQNVICYLLYISHLGLRCLRGVKQKIGLLEITYNIWYLQS